MLYIVAVEPLVLHGCLVDKLLLKYPRNDGQGVDVLGPEPQMESDIWWWLCHTLQTDKAEYMYRQMQILSSVNFSLRKNISISQAVVQEVFGKTESLCTHRN